VALVTGSTAPPPASMPGSSDYGTDAQRPAGRPRPVALFIVSGAVLLASIALVIVLTAARRSSIAKESRSRVATVAAGPVVRLTGVSPGGGNRAITLTGESRPYLSVTLYSKVSGYLKEVRVDKGDHVTRGEILAIVESPETDEAAASALADAKNKRVIADRESQLVAKKFIAPEEAETAETEAVQAEAHASALSTIKGYELLRAPFDGVITARFADPGALLQNAQNAQTSSLPVVAIGTTDSLRVFVYVDQRDAADVKRGTPVTIEDPSRPGVQMTGTVSRYTGELDPQTRTLLAEVDVPNHKGALVPGSIVQVTLDVHGPPYLHVPAAAVFANGLKTFVDVVSPQNRVAVREIHVIENDGEIVHFTSDSVRAGDRVALDLGNSVPDGQLVQPANETVPKPTA
jgi:RND family efflux transporter MFP subunit